jgi:hemerythrin
LDQDDKEFVMKTSEILWQDTQHQMLIELLDKIEHSSSIQPGMIEQLMEYAAVHFSMEERYMDAHQYPNTNIHKSEHRRFEQKLEELKQSTTIVSLGMQDDEFRKNIAQFLRTWLMNHIFGIDKDLESHLLNLKFEKVI